MKKLYSQLQSLYFRYSKTDI